LGEHVERVAQERRIGQIIPDNLRGKELPFLPAAWVIATKVPGVVVISNTAQEGVVRMQSFQFL
jgi:hypothetical protein